MISFFFFQIQSQSIDNLQLERLSTLYLSPTKDENFQNYEWMSEI